MVSCDIKKFLNTSSIVGVGNKLNIFVFFRKNSCLMDEFLDIRRILVRHNIVKMTGRPLTLSYPRAYPCHFYLFHLLNDGFNYPTF